MSMGWKSQREILEGRGVILEGAEADNDHDQDNDKDKNKEEDDILPL